nr:hypothetical protein Iba_chr07cCG3180 [Ipomoea batatas]
MRGLLSAKVFLHSYCRLTKIAIEVEKSGGRRDDGEVSVGVLVEGVAADASLEVGYAAVAGGGAGGAVAAVFAAAVAVNLRLQRRQGVVVAAGDHQRRRKGRQSFRRRHHWRQRDVGGAAVVLGGRIGGAVMDIISICDVVLGMIEHGDEKEIRF